MIAYRFDADLEVFGTFCGRPFLKKSCLRQMKSWILHGSFIEVGLGCGTLEASKDTSEKHGGSCNSRDPLCFPAFPLARFSGLLRLQESLLSLLSNVMRAQLQAFGAFRGG